MTKAVRELVSKNISQGCINTNKNIHTNKNMDDIPSIVYNSLRLNYYYKNDNLNDIETGCNMARKIVNKLNQTKIGNIRVVTIAFIFMSLLLQFTNIPSSLAFSNIIPGKQGQSSNFSNDLSYQKHPTVFVLLSGEYHIHSNGHQGTLFISSIRVNNSFVGSISKNPITGIFNNLTGKINFIEYKNNTGFIPLNVYTGYITDIGRNSELSTPQMLRNEQWINSLSIAGTFDDLSIQSNISKTHGNVHGWFGEQDWKCSMGSGGCFPATEPFE